jgi:chromosomal replication initiation ATPase DnaA
MPFISQKEHQEYLSLKDLVKTLDVAKTTTWNKGKHLFQQEKFNKIVTYLAYRFNIQITDILRLHKSRDREYTYPRHTLMYLANKYYEVSLKHIGQQFVHNYDHSSVIHGIRAINNLIETNGAVAREIKDICAYIEFKILVDEDLSELLQLKLEI